MFKHVKELEFDVRVDKPDPRFASMLLEQFGGPNGELKAAMQYFTQAFVLRKKDPPRYDLLMDIATEEFSHLEMVGTTITLLLEDVHDELKDAAHGTDLMKLVSGKSREEMIIMAAATSPALLALSGGGPAVTNSEGYPWNGTYVNANGDPTVDLRSNIAAESRAKIVYEYLLQFTDDPGVKDTLNFLMTREIAHFNQFTAALDTIQNNFPPGVLQGDERFVHKAFNMSEGSVDGSVRGPWNEGQGPWPAGEEWEYIEEPNEFLKSSEHKNRGEHVTLKAK